MTGLGFAVAFIAGVQIVIMERLQIWMTWKEWLRVLAGAVFLTWLCTPVHAQEYPDEATKRCALLKAYHMNGDSMVRWGAIDLSKDKDPCPKTIRVIPMTPDRQPKEKLR